MKILKIILASCLLILNLSACNHKIKFNRNSKKTSSFQTEADSGFANNMSGGAMGADARGVSASGPHGALSENNN